MMPSNHASETTLDYQPPTDRIRSSRDSDERSREGSAETAGTTTSRSPRRKGVLFCPGCAFEDHYDGDWIVEDSHGGERQAVICPECRTVLTRRPQF